MLFLKRLVTSIILFVVLFLCLSFGILAVGGGIAGARASADNPKAQGPEAFELGRKAGEKFGRQYGVMIFLGSMGVSFVASLSLSFFGILPWCREQDQPPPLH